MDGWLVKGVATRDALAGYSANPDSS